MNVIASVPYVLICRISTLKVFKRIRHYNNDYLWQDKVTNVCFSTVLYLIFLFSQFVVFSGGSLLYQPDLSVGTLCTRASTNQCQATPNKGHTQVSLRQEQVKIVN